MIIAIEGIDGAGKNTLVQALSAALPTPPATAAFPRYGTQFADLASDALHHNMGDLVDSIHGMALMFALDRQAHREELLPYAGSPDVMLLDRYVASNAAYTSARLRDDAGALWVSELEFGRFALPRPDVTVLLDTPAAVAGMRAAHREQQDAERTRDAYEQDGDLQQRTLDCYRRLANQQWNGPWIVAPHTIDAAELLTEIERVSGIDLRGVTRA